MKHSFYKAALLAALGISTAAAETTETPKSFVDALASGKVSLNARLRYEHVDQNNATNTKADALTLRTRLGYKTASFNGFQGYIEAENTTALVDDYSYPGGGTAGKSVIADPEVTEVSQAWASYTYDKTTATIGRQNIVLDNARFIGNVGWRQNYQTFDAITVKNTCIDNLTLSYSYVWYVKRIFSDTTAQPHWESNSHLINASYKGLPFGTLTGYAYLLDFDTVGATANSTQTYGASLAGKLKATDDVSIAYRLEYATQSDYGSYTGTPYDTDYYVIEAGPVFKDFSLSAGYEVLGSNNGVGFKTPLATAHAFNGWADLFLGTPGKGLDDLYFKASTSLAGVKLTGVYHIFDAETGGADYGDEIDLVAAYKVNKYLSLTAKAAFYNGAGDVKAPANLRSDVSKYWVQADYAF